MKKSLQIKTNAKLVKVSSLPVAPVIMLRFEEFAGFFFHGPCNIYNSDNAFYRACIWQKAKSGTGRYCWGIYLCEEDKDHAVLKYEYWDEKKDRTEMLRKKGASRKELLERYPSIVSRFRYIDKTECSNLFVRLEELNNYVVQHGIPLEKKTTKAQGYFSLYVDAAYFIHQSWDRQYANRWIETTCDCMGKEIETMLKKPEEKEKIDSLELDYMFPINLYKDRITGNVSTRPCQGLWLEPL